MAHGPLYRVPFRRRREGRTDYRKRLALLKSGKDRAVVRRSSRNVLVQIVRYSPEGDVIVASAESRELPTLGWKGSGSCLPASYLTGLLAGKRALEKGATVAIVDLGRQVPHPGGVLFAAVRGLIDAGMEVPVGEGVLPSDSRLRGEHIARNDLPQSLQETYEKITGRPLPPKKEKGPSPPSKPKSEKKKEV